MKAQEMLFWLMGTLGYYEYSTLGWFVAAVLVLVVALQAFSGNLNALVIGESGATQLGVDVEVAKRFVFLVASALVGLAVSVSGLIGFVGLMVPHLARLMLGPDHRLLLPAATVLGGAFLVLADLVARLAFVVAGSEPPVGVITAFLGGPFFLLLLRRRRRYVV
ncbi:MAG: hypothetical protein D6806_12895 [Deltaproteobacteria bacterium]|nr:MAG: hypothetical protein D6806_12895 [Deltaproteobacteria bacterium]